MKKMFGFGLTVLALASMAFGRVGPVSQYGQLQAGKNSSGKGQIYGACKGVTSGNEVQVQGMSLFWSISDDVGAPFWTADYVNGLVEKQNIQIIRAPMGVDEDWGAGNYFTKTSYHQGLMNAVVQAAIANDIYVIIDYHSHKASSNTDNAKTFFRTMAEKYGKYDNVIFEIFNEPTSQSWSEIKTYADAVISEIRKYSDNLVVVGNRSWDQYPNDAISNPINDKNVAYTFHYYAGSHSTGGEGANAVQAMNAGLSVFVTEWGTVDASGNGGFSSGNSATWLSWMNQHKLSGANWSVSNKSESASYFQGSAWNYSESGKWVNTNIFSKLPKSYTACSGSTPASSSSIASSSSSLPAGYTDYIDDFEDGDSLAFTGGIWYAYTDKDDKGGSSITNTPNKDAKGVAGYDVVINGDNNTKGMGAITGIKLVQGENKYEPYVALGLKLNADETAYDLSSCKTISYKYKGAAHNFKVEDTAVEDYAFHQLSKVAATSWTQVNVPWDMLVQPSWTKDEVTLSPKRITKFTWEVKGDLKGTQPSPNYLDIDDVRCDGLAIKPAVAKPASSSSSAKSSSSSAIRSSSSIASSSSVKSSSSVAVSSSSVVKSSSSVAAGMKVTGDLTQTVAKDSPFGTITITGVNSFNRDSWNLSFLTIENKNGTVTVAGTVPSWANSGSETLTINGEKVVIKLTVAEAGTVSSSSVEKPASSSAVNPVSSSSTPVVAAPAGMVDDFEDGDNQAYTSGYWFAYNDKGDKGASTFANEEDAENGGYVVIFPATNGSTTMGGLKDIKLDQGDNEYDPYVALGLNLAEEDEAYDLSSCKAISYDYIGAAHNFKAILAGDGKGAVTAYDRHTVAVPASTSWTTASIAWTDLEQAGWGDEVALSKSKVSAFHWEVKGDAAVPNYLYVDNFKCEGLKVVAPASSSSSVKPGSSSSVKPTSSSGITISPLAITPVVSGLQLNAKLSGRTLQVSGASLMNVDVFDMQGRPMMNFRGVQGEVSLESLPTGNYVVRVRAGSSNMTKRITVK